MFAVNNGMSYMGADLTYLNFVVGVLCMFAYQPIQDWLYRRGTPPQPNPTQPKRRTFSNFPQMQLKEVDVDQKPDSSPPS